MTAFPLCSPLVVIVVTGVVQQMAVKCLVKMVPLLKGDKDYFALREKGQGEGTLGSLSSWPAFSVLSFQWRGFGCFRESKDCRLREVRSSCFLWSSADRTAYRATACVGGRNSRM